MVFLQLLACDYHTCSRLRNFSDLSFRSLVLNCDSKLSTGPAVPLFGLAVPPSRAVVPQGEFDKSLSVCFDRPIHPPSRPTRDPTSGIKVGYLIYASPREVWRPEEKLVA